MAVICKVELASVAWGRTASSITTSAATRRSNAMPVGADGGVEEGPCLAML